MTQEAFAKEIDVALSTFNFILNHPTYTPRYAVQKKIQDYVDELRQLCPEEVQK